MKKVLQLLQKSKDSRTRTMLTESPQNDYDGTHQKNGLSQSLSKITLVKKGIALLLTGFLCVSLTSCAQNANRISQLEPVTPNGSGIFSLAPKGQQPPKAVQEQMGPHTACALNLQEKYLGVPYESISKTQNLDIYIPQGKGPFPVIVDIHGGAFMVGSSNDIYEIQVVDEGIAHGYAVVSINYRMSGEARFPRAVNDVKAAVRFVRANAQKYHFNPDKIVAWGGSAGGNLVAMLGTTGNVNTLNGDDTENLNYSSNVQAVVDWFGPCNFLKYDEQFKLEGIHPLFGSVFKSNSPETLYIGQDLRKDPQFTEKANPETYINTMNPKNAPYFFIQHGTADQNIPYQQSIDLANDLITKIGTKKVRLGLLLGAHHGDPMFSTPQNFQKVFNFLDRIFDYSYSY
ncbi:MAG: alpha/beta hydrolase [Bacteroidales bacterium]|nr:alpha/beta hydrolase [Bacteroidales bacterium]